MDGSMMKHAGVVRGWEGTGRFSWTARDGDVGPPSCTTDMGRVGPRARAASRRGGAGADQQSDEWLLLCWTLEQVPGTIHLELHYFVPRYMQVLYQYY